MAKQDGILKIQGTLENLTFYKSADGLLVRTRGGVSKQRIMNDPAFIRTRENGAEFAHSAQSGKMLRMALGGMVFKAKDRRMSSRLLAVMAKLKNLDSVNVRGARQVAFGIAEPDGKLALKGFDFNSNAPLQSVLLSSLSLDATTGSISISEFLPTDQVRYPDGATHFSLQSGFLKLDFASGDYDIAYSPVEIIAIEPVLVAPTLTPDAVPTGSGTAIHLLAIEFFQRVNGVNYLLKNGAYNVLHVVEVT